MTEMANGFSAIEPAKQEIMPETDIHSGGRASSAPSLIAEQVAWLYSASAMSMTVSFSLATIVAFVHRHSVSWEILAGWYCSILAVTLIRFIFYFNYKRRQLNSENTARIWLNRFRMGSIAIGLIWGSAGVLFVSSNYSPERVFLLISLSGLTSGGIIAFAADLTTSTVFCISTLLPVSIRLFMDRDPVALSVGLTSALYLSFLLFSLRRINRHILDNIVLRFEAGAREEAVRTSEERYRLLLNHSPVGIFHYDRQLAITYCNDHFSHILNQTAEHLTGMMITGLNDDDITFTAQKALSGNIAHYEGQHFLNFSGKPIWIDLTCAPFRDAREIIVGGIAIFRDITARKKTEEMLRISEIAFESQSGMIVTDTNAVILRVNRAFTQLTGYSAHEVLGKTPKFLNSKRHNKDFFELMWQKLAETGYWQGEIWNRRKNGLIVAEWLTISAVYAPDGSISHFVGIYSDITQNKDALAEIHRLAYYDPLTHLPNRRLLQDRLGQELISAARSGLYGAILFLDLDNFKTLNDTRGHNAGDSLLIEAARRLRVAVRDNDIVGRLGGDEFVVILGELSDNPAEARAQAGEISGGILETLAIPYHLDDYEFHCTVSIGVRVFRDQDTVDELLRHADLAMYQAKSSGRNMLRFFNPDMQSRATELADTEKDIRRALEQEQFRLYFQPQIYADQHIVGAEILLRWEHPQRGLLTPAQFIPVAEKSGLIVPVGEWLMEKACAQISAWQAHPESRTLRLSTNVSARQFRHSNFVPHIQAMVRQYGIKPNLLEFELTETLVLDNIKEAIVKMHALREIGLRFSLDDFGTGYSSFSYLTQLPLDQLKIDRSFVRNITSKTNDAIIVQTIIGMANNLGLEVIAEGVETEEQRLFLEEQGCPACQGYLYSEPLPLGDFNALLGI